MREMPRLIWPNFGAYLVGWLVNHVWLVSASILLLILVVAWRLSHPDDRVRGEMQDTEPTVYRPISFQDKAAKGLAREHGQTVVSMQRRRGGKDSAA